ncbi:MAG: hypothetical protein ACPGWR_17450, partial [Ardenticatenaceae bacterium]
CVFYLRMLTMRAPHEQAGIRVLPSHEQAGGKGASEGGASRASEGGAWLTLRRKRTRLGYRRVRFASPWGTNSYGVMK